MSSDESDPRPLKITACVITLNEADRLRDCLESLAGADELVVVDSGSTDATRDIAEGFNARVVVRDWPGCAAQRSRAVELASHDWVLCLDADERLSPELANAIRALKKTGPGEIRGYLLNRHTEYLGHWINHGGWYPQWRLRFFDRRVGRCTGEDPHDRVEVSGPTARLDGDLYHHTYRDLSDHVRTINSFTSTAARGRRQAGRRFSLTTLLLAPGWRFFRMYVLRLGFLDGRLGFVLAVMTGYYVFLKNAKLFELERKKRTTGESA